MSEAKAPQLPQWITDHLQRYLDTNGADGHMWDSGPVGGPGLLPTLLLTTSGPPLGQAHHHAAESMARRTAATSSSPQRAARRSTPAGI